MFKEPFAENIQDTSMGDRIKEFESRKDVVVKVDEYWFSPKEAREQEEIKEAFRQEIERHGRAREIFARLRTIYDIPMPEFEHVVGERNGKVCMYTITEKIEGQNIQEIQGLPVESQESVENLYIGLISYFADVFHEGGEFWHDIFFKNRQFVYGHKVGEKENKPYLIDADPVLSVHNPATTNEKIKHAYFIYFQLIHDMIVEAEQKFSDGIKLERARAELRNQVEKIRAQVPGAGAFDKILEGLS